MCDMSTSAGMASGSTAAVVTATDEADIIFVFTTFLSFFDFRLVGVPDEVLFDHKETMGRISLFFPKINAAPVLTLLNLGIWSVSLVVVLSPPTTFADVVFFLIPFTFVLFVMFVCFFLFVFVVVVQRRVFTAEQAALLIFDRLRTGFFSFLKGIT